MWETWGHTSYLLDRIALGAFIFETRYYIEEIDG